MRAVAVLAAVAALCFAGISANAQTVPAQRDQVAYPGGHSPGNPKVALVKIADGLHDPVGVASAFDGSGRIFVVERVGRIRIVTKDGKLLDKPFLDLTKINPLGNEVQTGFVEQGFGRSPSIPTSRRTDISTFTIRRCRSTAPVLSCA